MKTQRRMTPHAQCAKAIRAELKAAFPETKFRVTSQSFSMGNSVHIEWTGGPSKEEVNALTGKYQYGRFDGMTDSYDMSNSRDDLPQVKYVQIRRSPDRQGVRTEEPGLYLVSPPATEERPPALDTDLIERAKAALLAHLKARRVPDVAPMTMPDTVKDYVQMQLATRSHEVFAVLFLDTQHRLLAMEELFYGTLDAASVYPREVVKRALHLNAGAVILAHNHPSGDPAPSHADRKITQRLKEALGLLEIRVLDHIIVGDTTVSLAEEGDI